MIVVLCALTVVPFAVLRGFGGQLAAAVVTDPGPRGGSASAGGPLPGLSTKELAFFQAGLTTFQEVDSVTGSISGTGSGLGPRFNSNSCVSCHQQPAIGGSSPPTNPLYSVFQANGATNTMPSFITPTGPVLEPRFPYQSDLVTRDGGVHDLFTITGRSDASGCNISQPDFATAQQQNNLIFRQPTPMFGAGLIEAIQSSDIIANMQANGAQKLALGIGGHPNYNGNDGTITRFGWKAQNKSLLLFVAEAYNVEMGVTNELFQNERNETSGCVFNGIPEDHTNFGKSSTSEPADIMMFEFFARFLNQPTPGPQSLSTLNGASKFVSTGCALCHNPTFRTPVSSSNSITNVQANLFSDLLVHHMGPSLADNVPQAAAGPDEFRTAPLWGLGQRIFFLHDGRTTDLIQAIQAHSSQASPPYPASEANAVIANFNALSPQDQQDLINFLRSL